jgi:hypothetical protein
MMIHDFAIPSLVPEGCGPWGVGYLSSSARARITSAITNRQSMAIVMATRIRCQGREQFLIQLSSPPLRWYGPLVVHETCGPTAHSSEPIFNRRFHTRKRSAMSLLLRCFSIYQL